MSRSLMDLKVEFRIKIVSLLKFCGKSGIIMQPYCTLRDPYEQAKLWRQSRTTKQIESKIAYFEEKDAPFLTYCLKSVGPQFGRWATNAPPGLSWHQHGEAVDCYWYLDGRAEWTTSKKFKNLNGYEVYTKLAEDLGLTSLGKSLGDWPHVQLRKESSPAKVMSLKEIDALMKKRFV